MFKNREEATESFKENLPENGAFLESLFEKIDSYLLKTEKTDSMSLKDKEKLIHRSKLQVYIATERLFIFSRHRDYKEGLKYYNAGNIEMAKDSLARNEKPLFFYNKFDLKNIFEVFEEIKESIKDKNKKEILLLSKLKLDQLKKESKILRIKELNYISYHDLEERIFLNFKIRIYKDIFYSETEKLNERDLIDLINISLDCILSLK